MKVPLKFDFFPADRVFRFRKYRYNDDLAEVVNELDLGNHRSGRVSGLLGIQGI